MPDKTFVDTNILVYAHDLQAGAKHSMAAQEIERIWHAKTGTVSLQVLQEFYVTLTQKVATPVGAKTVRDLLEKCGSWEVVVPDVPDLLEAVDLQKKNRFSFWDALIVQSALKAGCSVLLSEDFQHGQKVENLIIRNPFIKQVGITG